MRILRLGRLISFLNLNEGFRVGAKVLKIIIYLSLYLHIMGCVFWFLIIEDKSRTWMPPLDYVWVFTEIYEQKGPFQYLSAVYHSVLMLTGNDMGPRTVAQYLFCFLAVVGGAVVNALLFGELVIIISTMNMR